MILARWGLLAWTAATLCACAACKSDNKGTSAAESRSGADTNVPGLCVTNGRIEASTDGFRIEASKSRAVLTASNGDDATLRFRYLRRSKKTSKLASGGVREQVGIKLRAQDSCNVIYVMWRIQPRNELVVSIKENPGEKMHSECGTAGYENLRGEETGRVPALARGDQATLSARLVGDDNSELEVEIDGKPVWRGSVGDVVSRIHGPAGLRTDNVSIEGSLSADGLADPPMQVPGC